ncbi:lysozyme [Nitrospirillum viridazoti Y2]|uniref:Lysozyme n=1 Tax=Nitrospirillum amazonense TaxID=28077 RepID=A0A560IIA0_9PROT|nr:lysozyme [Nitrospirillum amazonense]EGY02101.1 lysozyme [Nitrospirillum amazonense Y2]TWB56510.1 lysozyme [Nitrospirillum amazonense]
MTRTVNAAGIALTEQSEGLRLTAYRCPAGRLTIGYGHTGPDVTPDMTITEDQAQDLLAQDLATAGNGVSKAVTVPLTDNQYAALTDFAFNLGVSALTQSTLLRLLNQGDYAGAAEQFLVWDKAMVNGQLVTLPGLAARRQKEQALFLTA